MAEVYRVLYYSRNTLAGSLEEQKREVQKILASSRANNSVDGITGALLFNHGYFAQVLEGPLSAVENTFERIQRDMRHGDVVVLECGYTPQREFPEWSMAFSATAAETSAASGAFTLPAAIENRSTVAAEINLLLRTLVTQENA
jgi:hypothetical protein